MLGQTSPRNVEKCCFNGCYTTAVTVNFSTVIADVALCTRLDFRISDHFLHCLRFRLGNMLRSFYHSQWILWGTPLECWPLHLLPRMIHGNSTTNDFLVLQSVAPKNCLPKNEHFYHFWIFQRKSFHFFPENSNNERRLGFHIIPVILSTAQLFNNGLPLISISFQFFLTLTYS